MKKLILLLLFIPLVSFAQVNSFEDLKTINSLEQFKRVVIENRYEIYTLTDENDGGLLSLFYGFPITHAFKNLRRNNGVPDFDSFVSYAFYSEVPIPKESLEELSKLMDEGEDSENDEINEIQNQFKKLFMNFPKKDDWSISYVFDDYDSDRAFKYIFDDVKEVCVFYKIINDFSCYTCPTASFKGKIGFKNVDNGGMIMHFATRIE